MSADIRHIRTPVLDIAYEEYGAADGAPVFLMHGWPYDPRGYDWGGRAACIVAALWPERVHGLVTANGYNIQNIPAANQPASPEQERRFWYQYYFHTERARAGLETNRRGFCRLLWELWSPHWPFDDAIFAQSAVSFDNPDFVAVTIQSYRHRYGNAPGDPALEPLEARLAAQPKISVPTIILQG